MTHLKSHQPRKRFGQNFLQDMQVIDRIVQAIRPMAADPMIEIGPGQGALTQPLLKGLNHLIAIELDRDLHPILMGMPNAKDKLELISADALKVDFSQFGHQLRIVGNLPYNISSPLIFHLLDFHDHIVDMHFMLQKEVVERITAKPNSKAYGRLSVMVQLFCQAEHLFDVLPEAFYPPPKVDSAIIRLTPFKSSPYPHVNRLHLQQLLQQAFGMRRKTLANNLKPLMSPTEITALDLDPKARPETLSVSEYVKLEQFLTESGRLGE